MAKPPISQRVKTAFNVLFRGRAWSDNLSGIFGSSTESGISVGPEEAKSDTAILSAVRLIGESVAMLPLQVYRIIDIGGRRGKEIATDHPLYPILHNAPNHEQTSCEFRNMMQNNLTLSGNTYAEIVRTTSGQVESLWPLRRDRVGVERRDGKLSYKYQLPNGQTQIIPGENMLHLKGTSFYGLVGIDPVANCKDAIGLILGLRKAAGRVFKNGLRPTGFFSMPGRLSAEAAKRFKQSADETHGGVDNWQRIMLLEEDMKWQQSGVSPQDAELLNQRVFSVQEIARIFRIPPHLLGDLSHATFSNIEHQLQEFMTFSLDPWLVNWEQRLNLSLLSQADRGRYIIEFNRNALMRADLQTRTAYYAAARQWGYMTVNQILALENMNPVAGEEGDMLLVPLNMVPAKSLLEPVTAPVAAAEANGNREDVKPLETRAVAGTERLRLRKKYLPIFARELEKLVNGEVREIRKAVKKYLPDAAIESKSEKREQPSVDTAKFSQWVRTYYFKQGTSSDFDLFFDKRIASVERDYMLAQGLVAAQEGGFATPDLDEYISAQLGITRDAHKGSSFGQIEKLIAESKAEGLSLAAEMNQRLDEWTSNRPGKIADARVVHSEGDVGREVWRRNGVKKLRWNTNAGACEFCQKFSGKVVGIESSFLQAGDSVDVEGRFPLRTGGDILHPPLHRACQCWVTLGS